MREEVEDTREPNKEVYVETCMICGRHIYEGETYYNIDGDIVCDECDLTYIKQNFSVVAKLE